ncbi:unnamed protein product [Cylicocyclus nassatus]|uniref:Aquaporin-3 n=1 Tax=Cylicocyclus nassatus TaxID=53992 RepID=A0AA36DQT8_CYLNA|nr:unnamed protein product [Cylicocyclus nassatus]
MTNEMTLTTVHSTRLTSEQVDESAVSLIEASLQGRSEEREKGPERPDENHGASRTNLKEETLMERLRRQFHIENQLFREILAEFFCTAFLLFWGDSTVAQFVISRRQTDEWTSLAISWGVGLWLAVQMAIRISGAHLNPAVSFFLFTQKKISFAKFLIFSIVQIAGGFVGALGVFVMYYEGISDYDQGVRQVTGPMATAGIFSTYPKPYLTVVGGMIDQIFGTVMLCMGVATIVDKRNGIPQFLQPGCIGFLLVGIGMAFGHNSGYAINPARDLGPRLFTLCAGYGWEVFSYRDYRWFWIPIVGPMIGAVIGAWLYEFLIGFHLPDLPQIEPETAAKRKSGMDFSKRDEQVVSHNPTTDVTQP